MYPTWWGPPNCTRYNIASGQFNPNLGEKLNRMNWKSNNIDLQLDSVTINDEGLYKCDIFNERTYFNEIEVNVRGKFKYISKLNSTIRPLSLVCLKRNDVYLRSTASVGCSSCIYFTLSRVVYRVKFKDANAFQIDVSFDALNFA